MATTAAACVALLPLSWAAGLVLGLIGAVAVGVWPPLGLLLILLAVPFGSLWQVRWGVVRVGATDALVALTLLAGLGRIVSRRAIRVRWTPFATAVMAFLGISLVSLLHAQSAEYGLKEVVKWAEVLGVYLLVIHLVDERWLRPLVVCLLVAGALAAAHGVYQFLFGVGPPSFALFGRHVRAYGTFEQPNPYAGYLGMCLPLAIGLAASDLLRPRQPLTWRWRSVVCLCGLLIQTALIMSWSRGGWLGAVGAAGVMALAVAARSGWKGAIMLAAAGLLVCLAALGGLVPLPGAFSQRLGDALPYLSVQDVRGMEITDTNYAVLERLAHWQTALGMWRDHPWLGVGIGNYEPVYAAYAMPQWPVALGHAHNYYLNVGAELGLVGLLAYLVMQAAAVAAAWCALSRTSGWRWGVAVGVLGALTHLVVHNAFDNLYVHGMYLHFAVLVGMATVLRRGAGPREPVAPGD